MRALLLLFALLLPLGVAPAYAVQPDEVLSNPALEARARELSKELRCMVCQNQSIDDSDAPLARDLRLLVRERLEAGDTDRQVLSFMVDRYGEFVLMRPVLSWRNALLWGAPILAILVGGAVMLLAARRRGVEEVSRLTPDEEERVARLLAQPPREER